MRHKIISHALFAMLIALSVPAKAQQTGKIFHIGFLDQSTASGMAVLVNAFRQELHNLRWIDAKNRGKSFIGC